MLFNWKLKILSSIVAVAMLFTVCPSTTFAAKTYLHMRLGNKNFAPSVEEVKDIVSKNPEYLNEKDDDGHTPLDIAKANGLSEIVSFLVTSALSRDDQLSDFFTSFSHVPDKIAALEAQIAELKRNQLAAQTARTEVARVPAETGRETFDNILSSVYPVGSIYISINSANPSTLFGGTWVSWGNGRVPVGIDSADTDFSTPEKIGGEKAHTLTVDETPSHTHTRGTMNITANAGAFGHTSGISYGINLDGSGMTGAFYSYGANNTYIYRGSGAIYNSAQRHSGFGFDASKSWTGETSAVGSNGAHNILQPYITCYMWKRIA